MAKRRSGKGGGAYDWLFDSVMNRNRAEAVAAMTEEQKLAKAFELQSSLRSSINFYWPIIEKGIAFQSNWHIDCIAEHLQEWSDPAGDIQNLAICVPPRFGKSLWSCVAVCCYIWSIRPWASFIYSSHSEHLVRRDSGYCRDVVRSKEYRDIFPHVEIRKDVDTSLYYRTTEGGFRFGTTVNGQGIGEGADYIVSDDPMSLRMARSKIGTQLIWNWWGSVMSQRVRNPQTARRLVDMQRLGEKDLIGWLKSEMPDDWCFLTLPMEYERRRMSLPILEKFAETAREIAETVTDEPEAPAAEAPREVENGLKEIVWSKPDDRDAILPTPLQKRRWELLDWEHGSGRKEEGDLLWPGRFPRKVVDANKRALGPDAAGQYQQRPAGARGDLFDSSTFHRYSVDESAGVANAVILNRPGRPPRRIPMDAITWYQTIDTAMTAKTTSAYTVCGTFGAVHKAAGGGLIVWDVFRARVPMRLQFEAIKQLRYSPGKWMADSDTFLAGEPWPFLLALQAVEEKASGHLILETGAAENNPLYALLADTDKVRRAISILSMYSDGSVFHPERSAGAWVQALEEELLLFPNGDFKDQIDVMAYAGIMATRDKLIAELTARPTPSLEAGEAGDEIDDREAYLRRILSEEAPARWGT